jgi:predicted nicotinamide N-methyase
VVRTATALSPVPGVPEILLHQAHGDIYPLWERLGSLPFWAHPWPGGQALGRYLLDHPDTVRGRAVVDLGCGSGLVAVCAALAGAASVIALDSDPLALAATRLNASANGVRVRTRTADLRDARNRELNRFAVGPEDTPPPTSDAAPSLTSDAAPSLTSDDRQVLLAADVLYEPDLARAVLALGRRAVAAGATVLLADPVRPGLSGTTLPADALDVVVLARYAVPVAAGLERADTVTTRVLRLG